MWYWYVITSVLSFIAGLVSTIVLLAWLPDDHEHALIFPELSSRKKKE